MAITNWPKLRHHIDDLISAHRFAEAQAELHQVELEAIPNGMRADFAALLRRLGQGGEGLKVLWPQIFENTEGGPKPFEVIEYAACLRKQGLTQQAAKLLHQLPASVPRDLQLAFCDITHWDYEAAKKRLLSLLDQELEPALRPVIEINLIAAMLMTEELGSARTYIHKLSSDTSPLTPHLQLNLLELKAQLNRLMGETEKAKEALSEAGEVFGQDKSLSLHFVKKWSLLIDIENSKLDPASSEVNDFLATTRGLGHWNTLRDWDLQMALIHHDGRLQQKVYFGNPFERFQKQLPSLSFNSRYLWTDERTNPQKPRGLDLVNELDLDLPLGLALHRLLMLLSSDFYAPWSVERIFDVLCAHELYDPFSSNKKIYRHIEKLKEHLESKDWGFEFQSTPKGYRLRPEGSFQVLMPLKRQYTSPEEFFYQQISDCYSEKEFTPNDLQNLIPMSAQKWQRQLRTLKEANQVEQVRSGRASAYRLRRTG